jgi:hypothetical protein
LRGYFISEDANSYGVLSVVRDALNNIITPLSIAASDNQQVTYAIQNPNFYIHIQAVDFAGNISNTVLLTPPTPQTHVPSNLTPDGQGEKLDHLTGLDMLEFITIETPSGNVFYLVIDHTRANNNVYFLNPVTEWDLLTLASDAELAMPPHILPSPPAQSIVIEQEPPPVAEPPPPEPPTEPQAEEKSGGRGGMFIFLAIAGAGAFGAIYYIKILKPKKEREMYGDSGEEDAEGDDFEDVGDDEFDPDAYDVDSGQYTNREDENE